MKSFEELTDALQWLVNEIEEHKPCYLLLVGNRSCALHQRIRQVCSHCVDLEIIYPTALVYVPRKSGTIMALADEVEYGRTLYEECSPFADWPLENLCLRTFYLNNSNFAIRHRENSIAYLTKQTDSDRYFAQALRNIKAWKPFTDDREFHSAGIVAFSTFLRRTLCAPFNPDATLFQIRLRERSLPQLIDLFSRIGNFVNERHASGTFLPNPDIVKLPQLFPELNQSLPKGRMIFKIYPVDQSTIVVSPMVFQSFTINRPWQELSSASPWINEIIRLAKDSVESPDASSEMLAYYNIIFLASNVEAMRYFLAIINKGINDGIESVEVDRQRLCSLYGSSLGQMFAANISERVTCGDLLDITFGLSSKPSYFDPHVDMGKLVLIKDLCHSAYGQNNSEVEDPIKAKRAGLTLDEIRNSTGIDDLTLASSIDLLCELEWTNPFNKCTQIDDKSWQLERCYNTTHGDIQGFVAKIIRLADGYAHVKTNLTTLNKAAAFLTHTALAREVQERDFRVEPDFFGKRAVFYIDETEQELYLDKYLNLKTSQEYLVKNENGEFKFKSGIDIEQLERHFTVCDPYIIEGFLEKYLQIHDYMTSTLYGLQQSLRSKFPDNVLPTNIVAVFLDLIGSEYPEAGLRTISVNLNRALHPSNGLPPKNRKELIESMTRKVEIMELFADGFQWTRNWLMCFPQSIHITEILKRFFHYPRGSQILKLIRAVVQTSANCFPQSNLRLDEYLMLFRHLSCCHGFILRKLMPEKEHDLWIVSVDMRRSKEMIKKKMGVHWKMYIETVLSAWAHFHNGYHINFAGDEVIFGFEEKDKALGFATAASIHSNEICSVCLPESGYGVGLSSGRIIERVVGGKPSVSVAPHAPFDPIAFASIAAEGHKRIRIQLSSDSWEDMDPTTAFQQMFVSEVEGLCAPRTKVNAR